MQFLLCKIVNRVIIREIMNQDWRMHTFLNIEPEQILSAGNMLMTYPPPISMYDNYSLLHIYHKNKMRRLCNKQIIIYKNKFQYITIYYWGILQARLNNALSNVPRPSIQCCWQVLVWCLSMKNYPRYILQYTHIILNFVFTCDGNI